MKIEIEPYGEINGEQADLITLTNKEGMRISVTNFGCILTAVWVKDRNNHFDNVVLGYEALERYQQGHPFLVPLSDVLLTVLLVDASLLMVGHINLILMN